ncbi:MAG: RNA methyltransferase [Hyphomicrobium aestuarii]|nr:RNA methyltransferase [Hyphomicrobium aestuarii]
MSDDTPSRDGSRYPAPRAITSLTNDSVKAIRALDMRKARKETGLFVAEGTSILISAREFGFRPETLVYLAGSAGSGVQKGLVDGTLSAGGACLEVSQAVLEKLSGKDNPQTMLGVFRQMWRDAPDPARLGRADVWIALEDIRDPGNLGTIIRTADAFGAAGIILVGSCADPYSRDAIRATMGSIFAVPLVKMATDAFVDLSQRWPGDIVGTHLDAREDVRAAVFSGPVMIVMGSEGPGLSQELTAACRRLVKIPMAGRLDSLNLAIATAITLFEVRRPQLKL